MKNNSNNKPSKNTKANGSGLYISLIAIVLLFVISIVNSIQVTAKAYTNAYDVYIDKSDRIQRDCAILTKWMKEDIKAVKNELTMVDYNTGNSTK